MHEIAGLSSSQVALCIMEQATYGDFLPFFEDKPYPRDRKPLENTENILVVVPTATFGEQIAIDLEFFLKETGIEVRTFFPWEVLPFDGLSPTSIASSERLNTLSTLSSGKKQIVIASADALTQKILPKNKIHQMRLAIEVGQTYNREEFLRKLDNFGYLRSRLVEEVGQMAVRGAVIDVFPPGTAHPFRLEFFDDQLESIRTFSAASQRSIKSISKLELIPVREFLLDENTDLSIIRERAEELNLPLSVVRELEESLSENLPYSGIEHLQVMFLEESSTLLDYFDSNSTFIACDMIGIAAQLDDYAEIVKERASRAHQEGRIYPKPEEAYQDSSECLSELESRVSISFTDVSLLKLEDFSEDKEESKLHCFSLVGLKSKLQLARKTELPFSPLIDDILKKVSDGYRVLVTSSQQARKKRIQDLFESYDLGAELSSLSYAEFLDAKTKSILIIDGALSSGFRLDSRYIQVISDRDIFPDNRKTNRARVASTSVRKFLGSVSQLQQDDYVVHIDHGVAIYRGLKEIRVEGKPGDYLILEYAGSDKLFIPVENIDKVQKYIGKEGLTPKLSQLGSKNWDKAKSKVQKEVIELAGQLITLYAKREISSGYSFGEVDSDDYAFSDSFPFEETPDQERAINDVLDDMSRDQPMDRLVCGDVGYGKTEVAMRAAFKAVSGGKQVAILVPTTILADQHYLNFQERFSHFGINVACVSRFFSSKENKETLAKVLAGKVDIIIGTHRLLQKDVDFKELGLIIIDEEHRFGVAHKEKLKRFRESVDVLTLTATPIPRTLHMSLSGIRDLSVIETPPCDRQLTRTYTAQYEPNIVREAIMRELGRQGQVFYIYNRVKNITLIADELAELVPEARIAFAHGQMKEKELEEIMHKFVSHEIDVLVSTTIVESGLDISNANTMIIRNADRFGLAELYQLRGRVGRGSRRAYAYLLIPDPKTLGEDAKKRLQVLQSLDDLGVGFRLALQDMEIRGAGNLLGKDQSGQISAVGYELYSKILKDTVNSMQEGKVVDSVAGVPDVDPEVNIGFPAHIPPFYIPDVAERLLLYQRLVCIVDENEGQELAEEIEDRFGNMPEEMQQLLALMVFRSLLKRSAITSARLKSDLLTINFHQEMKLDPEIILNAVNKSQGKLKISPSMAIGIGLHKKPESPWDLHARTKQVLDDLGVSI